MSDVSDLSIAGKLCERIRDESEHTDLASEDYRRGFTAAANGCVVAINGEISKRVRAPAMSDVGQRARELLAAEMGWNDDAAHHISSGETEGAIAIPAVLRAIEAALSTTPAIHRPTVEAESGWQKEAQRQEELAKLYRRAQLTAETKLCREEGNARGLKRRVEYLERELTSLRALAATGEGEEKAKTEQEQIDEMLRICRGALLEIRDWQGERDGQMYRTPEGFKGSPFDYLRKLANDGLKASAKVAWGIDPSPTLAEAREVLEPFADMGRLIELETTGFDDEDELHLITEDGHLMDRFKIGAFRRAAALLAQLRRGGHEHPFMRQVR